MTIDQTTRTWIRNVSDERAAAKGCVFDPLAGGYVVWWIERYCKLYEGDHAGEPMVLRGCHDDELARWAISDEWNDEAKRLATERAKYYAKCVKQGKTCDWQYEVTMRLFSWLRTSTRYSRKIRRFRRAGIWVPKKNKKSPTLAAYGLYLTCADGEPGQKVFFGAKDGTQAREIAGKHACEMVESSPELKAECDINKNLMRITHERTRSMCQPMSSGDSRTKESKEGINGSVLIDETHVVDDDFIARISRAGISRSEPFHLEVSTAGNDPMGYGKRQYDKGKLVENGDVDDQAFFFASYEAPQDLTDEELAKDPVKYGRMANPAWGHTVHEEEYLDDYNRSKTSITDLADFKMYRLDVWQKSKNPWLKGGDWAGCKHAFTLEDFRDHPCWAGFDKSKTRDMTALVLVFPGDEPDLFYQWPIFWLPRVTAERHVHEASFLEWANQDQLNLIEGEVIYDDPITELVKELADAVRIQEVWYDKTFASDITLKWEQEIGITRIEFPQTTMMFAGPVADYERLVIQGNLKHPNHPVLNWQAGHCETYSDSKGRKTLVKPKHGDIKKIDGMVAGVMALHGARTGQSSSVYDTRGIVTIGERQPASVSKEEPQWGGDWRDDDDY